MSSMLGLIGITTAVAKYLWISAVTGGLPVRNIRVLGDSRTISLSDPRRYGKCFGKHSSRASRQMKTRGSEAIVFLNISTRSGSSGPLPPKFAFASWNASRRCFGMSPLPTSCFRMVPMMLAGVCSCWIRKSQYKPTTALSTFPSRSHKLSITRELIFQAISNIHFLQRDPPLTSGMSFRLPDYRNRTRQLHPLHPCYSSTPETLFSLKANHRHRRIGRRAHLGAAYSALTERASA